MELGPTYRRVEDAYQIFFEILYQRNMDEVYHLYMYMYIYTHEMVIAMWQS